MDNRLSLITFNYITNIFLVNFLQYRFLILLCSIIIYYALPVRFWRRDLIFMLHMIERNNLIQTITSYYRKLQHNILPYNHIYNIISSMNSNFLNQIFFSYDNCPTETRFSAETKTKPSALVSVSAETKTDFFNIQYN